MIHKHKLRKKNKKTEKKKKQNTLKAFESIMRNFQDIYYYGSAVDSWLPEIMLYPYIALSWKNIPTWYRIIGPPGSGKTAHLSLLADFYLSYAIDEFTPKSFVSGFRGTDGQDVSTLPRLNGKVLLIMDESTMMDQQREERNQVQAILRKAYDGVVVKDFGNISGKVEHHAYFNILAAATPQIDRYFLYNQALGERYINFRLQIPNRLALTKRAYKNQMKGFTKQRDKLKTRLFKFLRGITIRQLSEIKMNRLARDTCIECANFIAKVRTHVPRDASGRHITTLPQPEAAGRLVQQMTQIAVAGAIVRGSIYVKKEQLSKAVYISLCSMPAVLAFMLFSIWNLTKNKSSSWFSTQEIVLYTAIGRTNVVRILEDLAIHRILLLRKKENIRGFEYKLSDNTVEVIKKVNLFEYYAPPVVKELNIQRKDRDRSNTPKVKRKNKSDRKEV